MNYNSRRDKNVKGSDVYAIAELERHSCAIRVSWASTHEANFFAESFMQRDVGRHNTCQSKRDFASFPVSWQIQSFSIGDA